MIMGNFGGKKSMTYNYYSDPAHGWMKVPISHFKKYNIDPNKITMFSYMRNNHAYLEEDCDMTYFLNALKEKGINYKIYEYSTNKSSKIRSYERFQIA